MTQARRLSRGADRTPSPSTALYLHLPCAPRLTRLRARGNLPSRASTLQTSMMLSSLQSKASRTSRRVLLDRYGLCQGPHALQYAQSAYIVHVTKMGASAQDYYTQSGSGRFLRGVRVPHYILNALDDPFIDRASLPQVDDVGAGTVRLRYTQHGGHCGYVVGLQSLSVCWRAIWSKVLQGRRVEAAASAPNGYLPEELARFLAHVDHCTGGRAPQASASAAPRNAHGGVGLRGAFVALLACVRTYIGVLLPRLAGKTKG